jgi:hypothetical protein
MGWGKMLLLGDVGQQMDINGLSDTVDQMRATVAAKRQLDREQSSAIAQLQHENEELKLYLATLIRLLLSKGMLTQQETEAMVRGVEQESPPARATGSA